MFLNFILGDNQTKICGGLKLRCYRDAEMKLFGEDWDDESTVDEVQSIRDKCNCLPSCTSISYDAEIDRANYDYDQAIRPNDFPDDDFPLFEFRTFFSSFFDFFQILIA